MAEKKKKMIKRYKIRCTTCGWENNPLGGPDGKHLKRLGHFNPLSGESCEGEFVRAADPGDSTAEKKKSATLTLVISSELLVELLEKDPEFAVQVKKAALRQAARTFFKEITPELAREYCASEAAKAACFMKEMAEKEFGTVHSSGWKHVFQPTDMLREKIREFAKETLIDVIQEETKAQFQAASESSNFFRAEYINRLADAAIKKAIDGAVKKCKVRLTGSMDIEPPGK